MLRHVPSERQVGGGDRFVARALTTNDGIAASRLTIVWGIALMAIAAGQLAGALVGLGSITSPAGFATRIGFALAAETILLAAGRRGSTRRLGGPWYPGLINAHVEDLNS
jgi:hypothetical protein